MRGFSLVGTSVRLFVRCAGRSGIRRVRKGAMPGARALGFPLSCFIFSLEDKMKQRKQMPWCLPLRGDRFSARGFHNVLFLQVLEHHCSRSGSLYIQFIDSAGLKCQRYFSTADFRCGRTVIDLWAAECITCRSGRRRPGLSDCLSATGEVGGLGSGEVSC